MIRTVVSLADDDALRIDTSQSVNLKPNRNANIHGFEGSSDG